MKLTLNTAFSLEVSVTKYISVNCNSVYTPTRDKILSFKNACASFATTAHTLPTAEILSGKNVFF